MIYLWFPWLQLHPHFSMVWYRTWGHSSPISQWSIQHTRTKHRYVIYRTKASECVPSCSRAIFGPANDLCESIFQDGLINFYKKRQEFEILATFTLYQKVSANYNLPHSPHLVRWLTSTPCLTEDEK